MYEHEFNWLISQCVVLINVPNSWFKPSDVHKEHIRWEVKEHLPFSFEHVCSTIHRYDSVIPHLGSSLFVVFA